MFVADNHDIRLSLDELIDKERDSGIVCGPFERSWLLEKSPDLVRRNLALAARHPDVVGMPASPYAAPIGVDFGVQPASQSPVATTTTENSLWTIGATSFTQIPFGDMKPGRAYKVSFGGVFGTSSAAPTAAWTPRIGSSSTAASNVTLGASTGTTMIASLSAVPFYGEFTLGIRAIGIAASGATGTGNGFVCIGGITTAAGIIQVIGSTVAATIDNTVTVYLHVDITWGTSAAANTVTCQWVTPVRSYW